MHRPTVQSWQRLRLWLSPSHARNVARGTHTFTLLGVAALGGCAGPGLDAGFDAPDHAARLHAIERAAEDGDRTAIPRLVWMLESEDPAARMLAIRVLERLTGQTHGYDYAAEAQERAAAVERWEAWLPSQGFAPYTPVGYSQPPHPDADAFRGDPAIDAPAPPPAVEPTQSNR